MGFLGVKWVTKIKHIKEILFKDKFFFVLNHSFLVYNVHCTEFGSLFWISIYTVGTINLKI